MTKVKISSNWTALKPLEECVKVQTVQEFQDFDPEDIDPSHCIQVERSPPLPENDQDSCQISVTLLDPDLVISRLVLASQCKRLEIHEGCIPQVGPYIQTITGSILDDSDEELIVFLKDGQLSHTSVTLKLTGVQDRCWILGLNVVTRPAEANSVPEGRFDLSKMNSMLNGQDVELSDKAQDFKKLFETFQKSKPPSMMPMMMGSIGTMPTPEMLSAMMASSVPSPKTMTPIKQPARSCGNCDNCSKQIMALEQRLNQRLNQLEQNQNDKLDQIISLLTQNNDSK